MNLYSPQTDPKYQPSEAPTGCGLDSDVIISTDTQRANRIPPGQHRTRKWPVLHATTVPVIDPDSWMLSVHGLVDQSLHFTLSEFRLLPRVRVFSDFHCVTHWSRLGNLWEGVSVAWLLQQAGIRSEAAFAVIGGFDDGWTTNLPLDALRQPDVLLADTHDGKPVEPDHGGPVRLVVPGLYAWKSAKWVCRMELTTNNQPGFWERAGYHDLGDPWRQQRYREVT